MCTLNLIEMNSVDLRTLSPIKYLLQDSCQKFEKYSNNIFSDYVIKPLCEL